MTAPFIPLDKQPLPSIPRVLSLEEFEQAQSTTPDAQRQTKPAAPPSLRAQSDATRAGIPEPNPQAYQLKGIPRILTQYIAEPLMDHPVTSVVAPLLPGAGYVFTGMMGKDLLEYAAQKAAELSLPTHERQLAEQDPERIPGEQAAVETALLGAVPLAQRLFRRIRGEAAARSTSPAADGAAPPAAARDVSAAEGSVRTWMSGVKDSWQRMFAPANRSPQAKEAANILRATTGNAARVYEQSAARLDDFRRAIEPLPESDRLGFIDAIEGGRSQPSPLFADAAAAIRETLDKARDDIHALGPGHLDHFLEDYFPHIWTDPARAADVFASMKGSFEGSEAFRQERTIPTVLEGVRMGLEPVSTNPVDLTLLKLREMQRYLLAHQSLNEMKDAGLVHYVRAGDLPPDGYSRINDKLTTVFGPREGAVELPDRANITPEEVTVPGIRIMGEYWAPEPVARVVNNYLTPGLRGNALYDAYRGLGNILNQAQLGFSGFHLGFTSMDASVSRMALGLEYIASGSPIKGLREIASVPVAPVTNIMLGARVRSAYLHPETATLEMQALANAVHEAGGRIKMDSFYKNSAPEKMIEAWHKGEYGKATALSLPALLELTTKPIMEYVVPRQKLGVFADLATKVLGEMPADATLADRRAALARVWDSVDNRMGQLVYDNLFWDKTFKDLSMASVRSVGWNLGTIRELGGGVGDLTAAARRTATGDAFELTHRAAYVMALPLTVGMYGAIYQYLRTGEGPQELKDYFFPKTGEVDADGNPQRVQIASYMKDMFAYSRDPWGTIKHKANPILSTAYETLQNEDFYGDQIRNKHDPLVVQLAQEAKWVATQLEPFSFRNMQEGSRRGGQSTATKLGNWFGVVPAPRDRVRTEAQNRMAEFLSDRRMTGATPEDVEARRSRAEILAGLRGDKSVDLERAVTDAIERHQLTAPDVAKLLKRAGTTPAQEQFKRLTMAQAIDVFKRSTPRERALFAEALLNKVEHSTADASAP